MAGAARSKTALAALTILVFCLSRGPFLTQPMVGEEGTFGDLYLRSPSGPAYALIARIDGMPQRGPFLHPAPLYESMTRLGSLARHLGWKSKPGSPHHVVIRGLNSLFQLAFWLALVFTMPWKQEHTPGIALTAYFTLLISPMAVGGALYTQTDTTVGWLACGALAISVQAGSLPIFGFAAMALGFFGKQEWNICLLLSASVVLIWGVLIGKRRWAASLTVMVLASMSGMFLSWMFDPLNWTEGAKLLYRISAANNLISAPSDLRSWLYGNLLRAPYVGAVALGLLLQAWMVLRQGWRQVELRSAFSLSFSMALAAPFLVSTWATEYRYFAPALAAVSAGLVFEFSRRKDSPPAMQMSVLLLVLSAALGVAFMVLCLVTSRSVTEGPMAVLETMSTRDMDAVLISRKIGCIPRVSSGFAYAQDNLDFVASSLSLSDAQAIAAKAGRSICP